MAESCISEWEELSEEFNQLEVSLNSQIMLSEWHGRDKHMYFLSQYHLSRRSCVILQALHSSYTDKVKDVKAVQQKCLSSINHQRYRIKQILEAISKQVNCDSLMNELFYFSLYYISSELNVKTVKLPKN